PGGAGGRNSSPMPLGSDSANPQPTRRGILGGTASCAHGSFLQTRQGKQAKSLEDGARLCRRPAAVRGKFQASGACSVLRLVEDDTAALRFQQRGERIFLKDFFAHRTPENEQ